MKYRIPVHVSMDLEVEITARKNPDPAQLRAAAEELVERKLQSVLGTGSKVSGTGRARAFANKAKDEQGKLVFRQPSPRSPKPKFGETPDLPPSPDDGRRP
jgi:hypothetical protein